MQNLVAHMTISRRQKTWNTMTWSTPQAPSWNLTTALKVDKCGIKETYYFVYWNVNWMNAIHMIYGWLYMDDLENDGVPSQWRSGEHRRRHNGTRSRSSQRSPIVSIKFPKCSQCGGRLVEPGLRCGRRDRNLARWNLAGRRHFLRVAGWDDYLVLIWSSV